MVTPGGPAAQVGQQRSSGKVSEVSDMQMEVGIPLDGGRFLRRECPRCERLFKWYVPVPGAAPRGEGDVSAPATIYCPYCYEPAAADQWWTKEQVLFLQQTAV